MVLSTVCFSAIFIVNIEESRHIQSSFAVFWTLLNGALLKDP